MSSVPSVLAVLVIALAVHAADATSVNLLWTGSTGAGTTGSSAIQVSGAAPETLTLEIALDVDSLGLTLLEFSIRFDTELRDELNLLSIRPVSWQDLRGPGSFSSTGFVTSQESDPTREGQIFSFGGFTFGSGPVNTTLTFARVVFSTNPQRVASDGGDIFSGAFLRFEGGLGIGGFPIDLDFGSAEVDLIPEPATISLLALGIAALAAAAGSGRRGRRY